MKRTLFNLQEGEKIVKEIKPEPGLKWYFLFSFGDYRFYRDIIY